MVGISRHEAIVWGWMNILFFWLRRTLIFFGLAWWPLEKFPLS